MSELEPLARIATLGTAHSPAPEGLGGVEGQVLRALGEVPLERRLLLAAGARAVARAAARPLPHLEQEPEAAPPDSLPPCPPRVASVLHEALRKKDEEVLREAFERMARAGCRLPHELLPPVLAEASSRAVAEPVLGERGRWLVRFNPTWRPRASSEETDAAEAERLWTEGTSEQRRTVLSSARAREPLRAREWLQSTWTQEKAEQRASFLACLETGLSLEDEPLLEQARKDRAASVREVAWRLLARLPESAFSRRMAERARAAVSWQSKRRLQAQRLQIQLPTQWDAEAEKDGLDKPPAGVGRGEHWLGRLLGAVPLHAWEAWLQASPEEILSAATDTEHAVALSLGWAEACRLGGASRWAPALLAFWTRCPEKQLEPQRAEVLAASLLEHLGPEERARRALAVLQGQERLPSLARVLALTPGPWPLELARAWIAAVRGLADSAGRNGLALVTTFRQASLALPPECFEAATGPFELSTSLSRWDAELQRFHETVALRRTLHEELNP